MKKFFITTAIAASLICGHASADSFLELEELPALSPDSRGPCYYFKQNTYYEITADVVDENSNEYRRYFQIDGQTVELRGESIDNYDNGDLSAWRFKYKNYNIIIKQEKIINDKQILNTLTITGNGKQEKMKVIQFCPLGFG